MAKFWVGGTGSWSQSAHWATSSGGPGSTGVPTAADPVTVDGNSGGGTLTIAAIANCRSFDASAAPVTTLAINATLNVGDASGGAFKLGANVTVTIGTPTSVLLNLLSTSNNGGAGWAFTTAGKTLPGTLFSGSGGKYSQTDDITITSGFTAAGALAVTNATLVSNGHTITTPSASFNSVGSSTGGADLTGTTLNLTATGAITILGTVKNANYAFTAPTTVVVQNASASTRTINCDQVMNDLTYTVAGSTGQLTLADPAGGSAPSWRDINFSDITNARTLALTASSTYTITGTFNVNGTASKLMSLISTTGGTAATVSKSSGTVSCDYLSIKDSTATGGASFYAGTHSTSVSGNTGWTFTAPPATITGTGTAALGALSATATGTPTVSATANAALGSLSASATGTPKVTGTGNAALGGLAATATGLPAVIGTGSAPLGSLAATATGTPTDLAVGTAPLGGLTATATGIVIPGATERTGGNRRHLGNFPGRKELTGTGVLSYTLHLEGVGVIESTGSSSLPALRATGEIEGAAQLSYAIETTERHTVQGSSSLRFAFAAGYTGMASEDEDDELMVLLT